MAGSVVAYDRELPEIPGRLAHVAPDCYLRKKEGAPGEYEVVEGRRPSNLLLVNGLRQAVDAWRAGGYEGASEVTRRLLAYWFEEEHEVPGFEVPFRYHFCQREAMEALAYVVEVAGHHDAKALIDAYAEVTARDLFTRSLEYRTTMDGQRQLVRFLAERNVPSVQDLPPENLRRYAFKQATGSGKTWVMAMAAVWSYFHKRRVPGSDLSTNCLVVAPNAIVYQRLEKDFASNRIFHQFPLIPPEWRGAWSQKVILREESSEPDPSGNLFLTNVHQLYESRAQQWTPINAVEALLGRRPSKDLGSYERSMLERLRELPDLVVMNDEAHHVHDDDLKWNQSLRSLQGALPRGLSLWLDFSATPKDQSGVYYAWTICDYPLAQAVEDRIVKAPIIVTKEDDPRHPGADPLHVNVDEVVERYCFWIQAAVQRWKAHRDAYRRLAVRPVLFIMAETNAIADVIGRHLVATREYGFNEADVLVIHTDTKGEITKTRLEEARRAARDIDEAKSPIKAIVSVMMLREGWDVHNVSVVLGLRAFTAKAEILPEQVVGRGLRLMLGVTPDRTQTLEVLGTKNLLDTVREKLEVEGVGVATTKGEPPLPVSIYPVLERAGYDIAIPLTRPSLSRNFLRLADLDPLSLEPIYEQADLEEPLRIRLKMEFATTETEVHQEVLLAGTLPMAQALLLASVDKTMERANLSGHFAELYPLVRTYLAERCFGQRVELEAEAIRSYLRMADIREGIAKYLAKMIGRLTVEERPLEFERPDFRLSETRPFHWRRDLPPLECDRTIFNYVATYNPFERRFAEFLDRAPDVLRFASLGTTEQGASGTQFRVDYLKPSGAIGFYHPDWVVVQATPEGEVSWIIETKGRPWEDTPVKDAAMRRWCERVTRASGRPWRYARVDQATFEARRPATLAEAVAQAGQGAGPSLFGASSPQD